MTRESLRVHPPRSQPLGPAARQPPGPGLRPSDKVRPLPVRSDRSVELNRKTTIAALAALATAGVAVVPIGATAATQAGDPGSAPSRSSLLAGAQSAAP